MVLTLTDFFVIFSEYAWHIFRGLMPRVSMNFSGSCRFSVSLRLFIIHGNLFKRYYSDLSLLTSLMLRHVLC